MSCGSVGCCCGLVVGFILALVLLVAASFGIYCYFNPDAMEQSRSVVVDSWGELKAGAVQLVEKVNGEEPPAEPIVEPEVM